jgi:SAM-dependent methyltransferase
MIDWNAAPAQDFSCPLCRTPGAKRAVLSVASPFPEQGTLRLHACDHCGTLCFTGVTPPAYDTAADNQNAAVTEITGIQGAIKFYVEQGAAPDVMIEPLFWIDHDHIHRYAEVGCGFGFGLDFAHKALGWVVQGYDPSPAAAEGRSQLDLPISSDYLSAAALRGVQPFDLVLASEVIEHLADPHGFLADITLAVAPYGWLVLSTPNAAGVNPDATLGALLPLLTPGYHLVIFSASGLGYLLAKHGFHHQYLRATDTTLTMIASRHPFPADTSRPLDRRLYRHYLEQRLEGLAPDQPLAHGYAGRLFKEWVNAGEYHSALALFSLLAGAYRHRYGIDLDKPETVLSAPPETGDYAHFAACHPMNLCGLAYRRGFIALHLEEDAIRARAYFQLGERAGEALRRALQGIGCDDGETEHLIDLCRLGVLETAMGGEIPTLIQHFKRLLDEPGSTASFRLQADSLLARLFTSRMLSGDIAKASLLVKVLPMIPPDQLPSQEMDALMVCQFAHARGLYALNVEAEPAQSLTWLTAAREWLLQSSLLETNEAAQGLMAANIIAEVYAQATAAPEAALQTCVQWLADTQDSSSEHFMPCLEVFQRMVHAGFYDFAAQLEPAILARIAERPADITANLAFTLGILALNHAGNVHAAQKWFHWTVDLAPAGSELAAKTNQLIWEVARVTG